MGYLRVIALLFACAVADKKPLIRRHVQMSIDSQASFQADGTGTAESSADAGLKVYTDVPQGEESGIKSTHFSCRIRKKDESTWQNAFVFQTVSQKRVRNRQADLMNGYFESLENWTSSWVNFELGADTDVVMVIESLTDQIKDGQILTAEVHPVTDKVTNVRVRNGEIKLKIRGEVQFSLDINGQMEGRNTAGWSRPVGQVMQVHTFSVFANPILSDRPDPDDADVRTVNPNEMVPSEFSESTLYFLPGVHTITQMSRCCTTHPTDDLLEEECGNIRCTKDNAPGYQLKSGKTYYIPGDAWLDGWMQGGKPQHLTKVFGYGTLSGRRFQRRPSAGANKSPSCLTVNGCLGCRISGITCVDSPNHHFMFNGEGDGLGNEPWNQFNEVHHVKVMGWRSNGDGVHCFKYWHAQDIFLRTQDDSIYVAGGSKPGGRSAWPGQSFKRITTWNDANGVPFILGAGGKLSHDTTLEDSTAIYFRKQEPAWCKESGAFTNRNAAIDNFLAKNIKITDPFPTCPLFRIICTQCANHTYQNVQMTAFPATGLENKVVNMNGMLLQYVEIDSQDFNTLKDGGHVDTTNVAWGSEVSM